jgi:putative glutamine amidotransferase
MNKRKIFVVGGDNGYANWMEGEIIQDMNDADLVVFTGGEDVSPWLYAADAHPSTCYNVRRDEAEVAEFKKARGLGFPMVGICRGSQFLCAMAGGKLVQHQHHPSRHNINTKDGLVIEVTSSHHQRQYPFGLCEFELIGWCSLSPFAWGEENEDLSGKPEVEIAYYPKIKALAIQSHPEWQDLDSPSIAYFRNLLDKHMEGAL